MTMDNECSGVIVCSGEFPKKEFPLYLLRSAGRIICCDGAFKTWLHKAPAIFGKNPDGEPTRMPDAVIGDMDSLPQSLQDRYSSLITKVSEQESNDMMKAYRLMRSRFPEVNDIHFIGATGKRADHTIGNLGHLMDITREIAEEGSEIAVDSVDDYGTAFAVTDSCELHVGEGRSVSIMSPDNTLNIVSEGLEWQTSGVVFDNWWKATLNRATADVISLKLNHPSMVLIFLP
jgi:thiamine pyrophosphokinase